MKYKRVFILGFDGAGNAPKDVVTPNMDRIIKNGAYTYSAHTALPSISAECWGTMLHSIEPPDHGLNNTLAAQRPYPADHSNPSIFKLVRQHMPHAKLAAFSEWDPINFGIIESDIDCYKKTLPDDQLVQAIAAYLHENDPTLLFMELSECDAVGHGKGYFTPEYYDAVKKSDQDLGVVLDAIQREGMWEDSLIMLVTDHGGGGNHKYSHGSDDPLDTTVYWACSGATVRRIQLTEDVYVADTAAIAAKALDLPTPKTWIGRIPAQLFNEATNRER